MSYPKPTQVFMDLGKWTLNIKCTPRGPEASFSQCPGPLGTHPILKHNTHTSLLLAPHHLATVTVLTCVASHCLSARVGHLCDYLQQRRGELPYSSAHPQPHSTPHSLTDRSGPQPLRFLGLVSDKGPPHLVDRALLCSPSWWTPCRPGLWHRPWGWACWVFCWGSP